ncbi:hypothetical protein chiPu_0000080 [Chiloscyllium punctatum]|uniref:Ig-like domain-containing protein n=1 Tax=Chiloscyllium punctatum TaxID=137246 RepID=A0A401RN31_CHIPU|nr:hypothetical protein [Chiloscyllium punctatum]
MTARFICRIEGLDNIASQPIYWYQQKNTVIRGIGVLRSQQLTWLHTDFNSRFNIEVVESSTLLIINDIVLSDTAIYYCALTHVTVVGAKIFGTGTKLVVTGASAQSPKIQIFPPNITELDRDKKATIVCLLTDFFPDVIRVQWFIGENSAPEDKVSTDLVETQADGNYSVISRLKISKFEWDTKSVRCSAEHELTPEPATINKNSISANVQSNTATQTCSPSVQNLATNETKEWPMSSLQLASFTYTLLLLKSVVYCGIISFIVYKVEYRDVKKPL